VFSSYQFAADPLKKFRIGGGANRIMDRLTSGTQIILPTGQAASAIPGSSASLRLKDGTMTTMEQMPHTSTKSHGSPTVDETAKQYMATR
jgi:hypothetical protein